MIRLQALGDTGIRHAFFTRRGGVSEGAVASLNCGFGSGDAPERVARNRAISMTALDLPADRLVTCRQVHGTAVVTVEQAWRRQEAPRADAMATRVPGLALGVLSADCAPLLLHDAEARVVGAAHGGWRGALGGVVEAVLAGMEALGAERRRIHVGIGPCIAAASYEVGPEFPQPFVAQDPAAAVFFAPAERAGHFMFDLAGYLEHRARRAGTALVERARHDTVAEADGFFSYRRACLRGATLYGRGLSAIALG